MKTTLKPFIYSLIFTCFCFAAKAQSFSDSLRVSVGINGAVANGTFGTLVNTSNNNQSGSAYGEGVGAFLQADIPLIEHFNLTASAGYNRFFTTTDAKNSQQIVEGYTLPDFQMIPLKVGLKWFLGKKFYVQGEVGETILTNKKALYAVYGNAFTYAPQIGLLMPLPNKRSYIDVGLRYESTASFYYNNNKPNTFWAFHVAYAVKL